MDKPDLEALNDTSIDDLDLNAIWNSSKAEEFFKDIEESPLFFDESDALNSTNESLQALQSLVYDEQTPEEIMENFSKQTADAMNQGEKDFHTALSCINDAITYGLKVEERPYIRDKLADMYVTRSDIQIKKKNFGYAIKDAESALHYNKKIMKGYYYKSRALMELNKFDEAIKVLEEGKKMLQNKKWIDPVYKKCMFLKKKKEDEERKIEEIKMRKEMEVQNFQQCCQQMNYKLGPNLFEQLQYNAKGCIEKDSNGINTFYFPLLLLYPEYQQSDCVLKVNENDVIADHIQEVLGDKNNRPFWDKDGLYTPENIELWFLEYMVLPYSMNRPENELIHHNREQHYIRIDPQVTLKTLMKYEKFIIPEYCVLYVIVKNSTYRSSFLKGMRATPYQMDTKGETKFIHRCNNCKKFENLNETYKHCSRCKKVFYCSRDCQVADWKNHKLSCKAK